MEQWEDLPIFKKSMEIRVLVETIIDSVQKTDLPLDTPIEAEMIQHNLKYMGMNASLIPAKIAGAASEDTIYEIRMENATLIRKAARELITDVGGLEMHGYPDIEYLDILRQEIEAFRILFAEWVKTFDCWNYIIDRWGLFNPPGINYDDVDPDDDIPFNFDDFDGFDDL